MTLADWMAVFVVVVFNLPVFALIARLPFVASLKDALKEKDPIGGATDTTRPCGRI